MFKLWPAVCTTVALSCSTLLLAHFSTATGLPEAKTSEISTALAGTLAQLPPGASANGKYSDLLQVLPCPGDRGKYGDFYDYGYWKGGAWCGQSGSAGYWVWVYPNWYVWSRN